jgi:predicted phosphohydrolase
MHIVALSDLHGNLPPLPACDLLLLAGDLCPLRDHSLHRQAQWLDAEFRAWLQSAPARKIVGVAGNHDWIFQKAPRLVPPDLPWTYLQDGGLLWEGLRLYGSPWQPWFFDWAFNAGPDELRRKWQAIPDDTDVLLLHCPPRGYGDRTVGGNHAGCPHLLERIEELRPRLAVFGHIHEGRGQWTLGPTTLANVSIVDEAYEPVHAPWEWELTADG